MATKKVQTKKRRRHHKGMSAAPRRRRKSHKSRGLLSDLTNPTMLMNKVKEQAAGILGGLAASTVNRMVLPTTSGKIAKIGTGFGGGLLASFLGFPNLGIAFSGGMTALATQNGLLNEDANFADPEILDENSPMFLDEAGNPMVLDESEGEPYFRYLTEDEMVNVNPGYYNQ